jgi:hypothetical protein
MCACTQNIQGTHAWSTLSVAGRSFCVCACMKNQDMFVIHVELQRHWKPRSQRTCVHAHMNIQLTFLGLHMNTWHDHPGFLTLCPWICGHVQSHFLPAALDLVAAFSLQRSPLCVHCVFLIHAHMNTRRIQTFILFLVGHTCTQEYMTDVSCFFMHTHTHIGKEPAWSARCVCRVHTLCGFFIHAHMNKRREQPIFYTHCFFDPWNHSTQDSQLKKLIHQWQSIALHLFTYAEHVPAWSARPSHHKAESLPAGLFSRMCTSCVFIHAHMNKTTRTCFCFMHA